MLEVSAIHAAYGAVHALENVSLALQAREIVSLLGAWIRRRTDGRGSELERVYDLFPRLKERAAQAAGTLSGGEQQMLMIGRALMARPRLLMFDEPSLGLSPILVQQVFKIIRRI